MHTAGGGEGQFDAAVQERERVEAQRQLGRGGRSEVAVDVERVEVDVGLVEAVEHHDTGRADVRDAATKLGRPA